MSLEVFLLLLFFLATTVVLGIIMFRQMKNTGIALLNGDKQEGWISLFDAIKKNAYETVAALLKQGTDVNARGKYGRTLLHYAAEHNARETAEVLLQNNAAINAMDNFGKTPLHYAVKNNARETAEVLLRYGGIE